MPARNFNQTTPITYIAADTEAQRVLVSPTDGFDGAPRNKVYYIGLALTEYLLTRLFGVKATRRRR